MSWAAVVPQPLRPKPVATALEETARLTARVETERRNLDAAREALETAEAADTAQMAEALRAGREPESQTGQVEQKRALVAEAERRLAAAEQAHADSDRDLGARVVAEQQAWAKSVDGEREKTRARARKALAALEENLGELVQLDAVATWLDQLGDKPVPVRTRGLLRAPSSTRAQANRTALTSDQIVAYAAELIDPPAPGDELELAG